MPVGFAPVVALLEPGSPEPEFAPIGWLTPEPGPIGPEFPARADMAPFAWVNIPPAPSETSSPPEAGEPLTV
jgi:hypothetical protein